MEVDDLRKELDCLQDMWVAKKNKLENGKKTRRSRGAAGLLIHN